MKIFMVLHTVFGKCGVVYWLRRGYREAAKQSIWVALVQLARGRYPTTAEYKRHAKE